ncbi:alpha/beta hydrolase [Flavobacterium dankookense]|uniref:Pimeloyl-ACP methyl ester carboxylesterase n=1 Tax=Flavobacterium dankookense TaxID=706186 RepID=A0A4R6QGJ1_9FLAO|nr:alpha/beta hydrolase [Flavobacterium dankookense]TDP60659.1 pimeloyl-ACP methyl ester carboxylesterase [Flavobacterium dankookense]
MTKKAAIPTQSLQIPKPILITAKFLEAISPKLAMLFAAKLFVRPIKHKIPKRELHMVQKSIQTKLFVPQINKNIIVYRYGDYEKKILLVHGWSGRGTQMVKIADKMLELGYATISFDAPAHGKSEGKTTLMPEFITSILEIEKQFGPFEFAIGHSLGGMSILNAIKQNLNVKKAVIIGSGDIIQDIIDDFIQKLQLKPKIGLLLKNYFEEKFKEPMENYAASFSAKSVTIPVLIIHDSNDDDVAIKAAHNIHKHLKNSTLMITEGLGHRKILGDTKVIETIKEFIYN